MQSIKIILLLISTISLNQTTCQNYELIDVSKYDTPLVEDSTNYLDTGSCCIDPELGFNFDKYAKVVEFKESGGNPKAVSKSKLYVGLYQFGDIAFKEIGEKNVSVKKFIADPSIFPKDAQLSALKRLACKNAKYLETEINRFDGKYVHGYKITKAGILAAAHHIGFKRVKTFLYTGKVARDGSGVPVTTFLKKMASI